MEADPSFRREDVALHAAFNDKTRGLGERFAQHRSRLMQLIDSVSAGIDPVGRVAILGAGNCNDIDLHRLVERFDEVHLLDLDDAAVGYAVDRLSDEQRDSVVVHAPVDIASPLLSPGGDDDPGWQAGLEAVGSVPVQDCDVVVSAGLLSQLALTVHRRFPSLTEQQRLAIIQAVRRGHWRRILAMLRVGGTAVLGLDFVSSDSAPALLQVRSPGELAGLTRSLIAQGNFFSGMNPGVIAHELNATPGVAGLKMDAPWLWDLADRRYLVAGMTFVKQVSD